MVDHPLHERRRPRRCTPGASSSATSSGDSTRLVSPGAPSCTTRAVSRATVRRRTSTPATTPATARGRGLGDLQRQHDDKARDDRSRFGIVRSTLGGFRVSSSRRMSPARRRVDQACRDGARRRDRARRDAGAGARRPARTPPTTPVGLAAGLLPVERGEQQHGAARQRPSGRRRSTPRRTTSASSTPTSRSAAPTPSSAASTASRSTTSPTRSNPVLRSSFVCPGGQGDVSVYGNLLFMSVEETRGRIDCGTQGAPGRGQPRALPRRAHLRHHRHRQPGAGSPGVQTCRGSHTHTIVTEPEDPTTSRSTTPARRRPLAAWSSPAARTPR